MVCNYNLLYHNISPFCEPLSFVQFQYHKNVCFVLTNFTLHFIWNYTYFRPYFNMNFLLSLQQIDYHTLLISLLCHMNFTLHFIQIFFLPFAYEFFLLQQIDYHTFDIALSLYMDFECCTLEIMNLIVIFKFFDAKPILQCLWFTIFTELYFHWKLFCYCHQLLSYVFSFNNSSVQYHLILGKAVLRPPFQASLSGSTWHRVCLSVSQPSSEVIPLQIRCLYFASLLGFSPYLPLLDFFFVITSVRLFSVFASSGPFVMLSVGWLCSLVVLQSVWPLGPSWRLCMLGTMGMPVPEAKVCWVCWGLWGSPWP